MDLRSLIVAQSAAGARYSAAVAELHDALIELASVDEALQSGAVGYDGRADLRTFFNVPQNLGTLAHPVFAPLDSVTCWREQIKTRRDDILAAFNR